MSSDDSSSISMKVPRIRISSLRGTTKRILIVIVRILRIHDHYVLDFGKALFRHSRSEALRLFRREFEDRRLVRVRCGSVAFTMIFRYFMYVLQFGLAFQQIAFDCFSDQRCAFAFHQCHQKGHRPVRVNDPGERC